MRERDTEGKSQTGRRKKKDFLQKSQICCDKKFTFSSPIMVNQRKEGPGEENRHFNSPPQCNYPSPKHKHIQRHGTGQPKASHHNYPLLFLALGQKNYLLALGLAPVPKIFQHFSPPVGYGKLCAHRFRLSTAQHFTCQ